MQLMFYFKTQKRICSLSNLTLWQGDCLELMKRIPDGSIDMVLADPPYGTTQCSWDSTLPLDKVWEQLERIVKPDGAIVLTAQSPFDKVLACSNLSLFRYEWIWEKGNATGFLNSKKMPLKAHENVLVFYKNLPTYNPQKTTGHEKKTSKRGTVGSECYGKNIHKIAYESTDRFPRTVQFFSSDKQKENLHPVQKPVALMEYMIKTYTNEDETVLDFTMGSGTTGLACLKTGRNFIGIELEDKYFNIAHDRLKKYSDSRISFDVKSSPNDVEQDLTDSDYQVEEKQMSMSF